MLCPFVNDNFLQISVLDKESLLSHALYIFSIRYVRKGMTAAGQLMALI